MLAAGVVQKEVATTRKLLLLPRPVTTLVGSRLRGSCYAFPFCRSEVFLNIIPGTRFWGLCDLPLYAECFDQLLQ